MSSWVTEEWVKQYLAQPRELATWQREFLNTWVDTEPSQDDWADLNEQAWAQEQEEAE